MTRSQAQLAYQGELAAERAEVARQTHYDRLAGFHGHDKAQAIIDGKDEATNADLAKWRALGAER